MDVLSLSLYNCVLVKKGSIEASNRLGDCRPRCVCCDLRVERSMGFCVLWRYVITPKIQPCSQTKKLDPKPQPGS